MILLGEHEAGTQIPVLSEEFMIETALLRKS